MASGSMRDCIEGPGLRMDFSIPNQVSPPVGKRLLGECWNCGGDEYDWHMIPDEFGMMSKVICRCRRCGGGMGMELREGVEMERTIRLMRMRNGFGKAEMRGDCV